MSSTFFQHSESPAMRPSFYFTVGLLLIGHVAQAEDWPHWRGPNRNGVVDEGSHWNGSEWPLEMAWELNVSEGSSSPVVAKGRVYTMGWHKGTERVVCLDSLTGKLLWDQTYRTDRYGRRAVGDQGIYSGPSSTPEYDAATGYLYTLSCDGDLNCWDTSRRGEKVWFTNLYDVFTIPARPKVGRSGHRDYGFTSSPLVVGDWLIVEAGAKQGTLIAYEKKTGRIAWASKANSPAGHNGGPVPITVENVPCVAVQTHDGLLVVRLDEDHVGKTVATVPWVTSFSNNIATATVHEDCVLITSAYNQYKMAKYQITLAGAKKLWENDHASKVCSPVVVDGYVYCAWQSMFCLEYETGKLVWKGGRVGDQGSVIATSDDRLIVWTNEGDLTLVESAKRSPDEYTELASRRRLGKADAWPHVVLAEGRLYCKTRDGQLRCFRLGE